MTHALVLRKIHTLFDLDAAQSLIPETYRTRFFSRLELYGSKSSPQTLKSYAADFRDFSDFCQGRGVEAVPADPATVFEYVKARLDDQQKRATVRRKLAGIKFVHRMAGATDPTGQEGTRQLLKPDYHQTPSQVPETPAQQVPIRLTALECEDVVLLDDLIRFAPQTLRGLRAKMLVSVGFDTGLRGSEIASIQIQNLQLGSNGGSLFVDHIKGRPDGDPIYRSLSAVSVQFVRQWLTITGLENGPLFCALTKHGTLRNTALRRRALSTEIKTLAGLVPKESVDATLYATGLFEKKYLHQIARLSTHSFRIGHAQELFVKGAGLAGIMKSLDWKNPQTLQTYLRHLDVRQSSSAHMLREYRTLDLIESTVQKSP